MKCFLFLVSVFGFFSFSNGEFSPELEYCNDPIVEVGDFDSRCSRTCLFDNYPAEEVIEDDCNLNGQLFLLNDGGIYDMKICFDVPVLAVANPFYVTSDGSRFYWSSSHEDLSDDGKCILLNLEETNGDLLLEFGWMIEVNIQVDCDGPQMGGLGISRN